MVLARRKIFWPFVDVRMSTSIVGSSRSSYTLYCCRACSWSLLSDSFRSESSPFMDSSWYLTPATLLQLSIDLCPDFFLHLSHALVTASDFWRSLPDLLQTTPSEVDEKDSWLLCRNGGKENFPSELMDGNEIGGFLTFDTFKSIVFCLDPVLVSVLTAQATNGILKKLASKYCFLDWHYLHLIVCQNGDDETQYEIIDCTICVSVIVKFRLICLKW